LDTLAQIFPTLCSEVEIALIAIGRDDLASRLRAAQVKGITFDNSADAGYIYVHSTGAAHGETICLEVPSMVNVDVGADGRLKGIELVSPPGPLKAELRTRARSSAQPLARIKVAP
jgi:uncharacterized protein YuzE